MLAAARDDDRMTSRLRVACGQVEARDLDDAALALDEALAMCDAAAGVEADLIVLPEGTYPGYVMGSVEAAREALARGPDAEAAFAAKAARYGMAIVVGLVVDSPAGLLNAAVHFDATGAVRARTAKRFLWHFDRSWFVPGGATSIVDGVGTLVCADGRLPEITADLAARGARVLVNSTAWVTPCAPPEGSNPQAEFLWRVRALESGLPAIAATKVGTEAGVCTYSGGSQIVAADGRIVAVASTNDAEVLVGEIDVPARATPHHTGVELPAQPVAPVLRAGHAYCVVVSDGSLLGALQGHGADLVVGPDGLVDALDAVDAVGVTVECVHDDAMLDPFVARAAAMRGCEFVAWVASETGTPFVEAIARARAMENRVFVPVWRPAGAGGPFIVAPSGRVVARTPDAARPYAVGAPCLLAEAATKQMAPGTDAWAGALEIRTTSRT